MFHMRLVKAGYGSLREVKEMTAREVLQAMNYETFCNDYEAAAMERNS